MTAVILHDLTSDHVLSLSRIISHPDFFYAPISRDHNDPHADAANYCQQAEDVRLQTDNHVCIKGIFKEDGALIGVCGLSDPVPFYSHRPDWDKEYAMGGAIAVDERGQGYGTRAAFALMNLALNTKGICNLSATVDTDCKPAVHIFHSLGMTETYMPLQSEDTCGGDTQHPASRVFKLFY